MKINNITQNLKNKDLIFINDLNLRVIIGKANWEQQLARVVTINIVVIADPATPNVEFVKIISII